MQQGCGCYGAAHQWPVCTDGSACSSAARSSYHGVLTSGTSAGAVMHTPCAYLQARSRRTIHTSAWAS
eukprot:773196-Pelagomonas_calceolata.AAC.8